MKKVFLSAVVALAIVGAVAAKVNTKSESYYYKIGTGDCTLKTDFPDGTCTGSGNNCQADVNGQTANLYTAVDCPSDARAKKP